MKNNQRGFTLVELLCVIIVLGIIFTITLHKFGIFEDNAAQSVIDLSIEELNTREKLVWSNIRLNQDYSKPINDQTMEEVDRNLGSGTDIKCENTSCIINIRGQTAAVVRKPATNVEPAIWSRQ